MPVTAVLPRLPQAGWEVTRSGIEAAAKAANRFLRLSAQMKYHDDPALPHMREYPLNKPKLSGELKRASMDLTRRLAEMRKR